ncbi:MAG TPA: OmpH family outer membrane protein [Armatimonadota bacterium]|nr:OmpH family outer membrane protein [Armatimonadota bacterium]
MDRWKVAGTLAAIVLAGTLGTQLPGLAQKKGKVDTTVGFVDLGQVTEQIKKTSTWQVKTKEFEDKSSKFGDEFLYLQKIRYLTESERKELETLKAKTKASGTEQARIDELEKRSEALDKEFQQLAGTEKPSPEQDKRIKELSAMRQAAIDALQGEQEKRAATLRELQGAALESLQGEILKKVSEVADSKNLTLVVDRQAVLFGGQDVTPDVLRKLGANTK